MHAILRDLGLKPQARKNVKPLGQPKPAAVDQSAQWASGAGLLQRIVNDDAVKGANAHSFQTWEDFINSQSTASGQALRGRC